MSPGMEYESVVRLLAFSAALGLLVSWERVAALRQQHPDRRARWPTNFGLGLIDVLVVRVLFPAGAVGAAVLAQANGWGALNRLETPAVTDIVISVLVLDLVIYFQHWLFHAVPVLWRFHRVHHADPALDVSTALRFHPVESLLSMVLKAGAVLLLGLPAAGVLIFEVILNAAAMFNHTNASLGARLEPWVRRMIVTPDMHRIHHSTRGCEAFSNFGFSFSWWDRIFRTYRPAPRTEQSIMSIGLPDGPFLPSHVRLGFVLRMPFVPILRKRTASRGEPGD